MRPLRMATWSACCAALTLATGELANAQVDANANARTQGQARANQRIESIGKARVTTSTNGKNRTTYQINDDTKVRINGREARFEDLRTGDDVRVTTSRDGKRAVSIEGTRRNQASAQGQANGRAADDGRVRLGVRIQESPTTGVYVADTMRGGPAAQAGIRSGDYILAVDGKTISSPLEFRQVMKNAKRGNQSKVQIWRNNAKQTLTVRLPKQPLFQNGNARAGIGERAANNGIAKAKENATGWLGVRAAPAREKEKGVRIVGVYPSGPAATANLQPGDQLIKIDGQAVSSPADLEKRLGTLKPNKQVELVVLRNGEEETLTATLGNPDEFISSAARNAPISGNDNGIRGDYNGEPTGHAMMLQQHRHFARQHERIEKLVLELKQEIQSLRKEVQSLKNNK